MDALRELGKWGVIAGGFYAAGTIFFCVAMEHTTAANVFVAFSAVPLFAALFSWIFLHEKLSKVTLLALVFVTFGILVVSSESVETGTLWGDIAALLDAVAIAGFYTVVRHRKTISMIPAIALGLALGSIFAWPLSSLGGLKHDQLLWLALGGGLVVPFAAALVAIGLRYLPAPDVALLSLLEVVLGPFLVWLVLNEAPGLRTIIGGLIVVLTVSLYTLHSQTDNSR